MTHFEKIKQMDLDEMAEFIEHVGDYDGFESSACEECPHHLPDGCCASKNMSEDCVKAIKAKLLQEVQDATRENEETGE